MQKNILGWGIGVIGVLVLAGLVWWLSAPSQDIPPVDGADMATTTTTPAQPAVSVASRNSSDVAGVIAGLQDGTRFSALLVNSGLAAQLHGKGPYTVFVPTNGAFELLTPGALSGMTGAQLRRLAEYHIVSGRALDVDAVSSGEVQAMSKDMLNFTVHLDSGSAQVGSGWALQEFKAQNGIVYLVSAVLLPPQNTQ